MKEAWKSTSQEVLAVLKLRKLAVRIQQPAYKALRWSPKEPIIIPIFLELDIVQVEVADLAHLTGQLFGTYVIKIKA